MSYLLAALGFVMLVILHELGHFSVAKAVGMRVERFSLFFPPHVAKRRVGETEYALGTIPLGGYVKISGMNPDEKLPDEVRTRAYYAQPPWKRMVVIAAGPLVNLVLAIVLLWVFAVAHGPETPTQTVGSIDKHLPAAGVLQKNDKIVAVDGHAGGSKRLRTLIRQHRCAVQPPRDRCRATSAATLVIERHGERRVVRVTPVYDATTKAMRIGFTYGFRNDPQSPGAAIGTASNQFWYLARQTVTVPLRVFNERQRKQISGAVGSYEVTRETIETDATLAIGLLGLISLSLAIVNLYPFLPLDGGHIFWAIVEKIRRRPVPFSVMERASVLGFGLVLIFFFIGLSNDIGRVTGEGFQTR